MKERPILMSAPMVRATWDDLKTMTRRVVKGIPDDMQIDWVDDGQIGCSSADNLKRIKCPYGTVGDRLWAKERYRIPKRLDHLPPSKVTGNCPVQYGDLRAEGGHEEWGRWRSPRFMPRWASRLTLEIVSVKVERLNDISEEDARAEGMRGPSAHPWYCRKASSRFRFLWESINGPGSWSLNPWVWAVSFKVVK